MVNFKQIPAKYLQGFTYLGVLFIVALLGASLALAGTTWKTLQQCENEQELLFIGDQFKKAITLYYERTPSAVKTYPKSLEQLLKDNRYISPQRYLRKIYHDPITLSAEWGLVRSPDGGIMGVYSLSNKHPRKQDNFKHQYADFTNAQHYSDWKFVYRPVQSNNTTIINLQVGAQKH